MLTDATGDAVGFRPEGLVMKLYKERFADRLPVAVSGNSPQRPIRGTVGVDTSETPSGSPTYPLDVMAALSADRKTLTVSAVNPTETAQELDLKIAGVELRGACKRWQIAAPSVDATNVPGQKPVVDIAESAIEQIPSRVTVPPISISVYGCDVK